MYSSSTYAKEPQSKRTESKSRKDENLQEKRQSSSQSPIPSGLAHVPSDSQNSPTTMSAIQERQDEDVSGDVGIQRSSRARSPISSSSSGKHEDWRYSSTVKRKHSQRSPSRPRSQQGSQAAQIASVKEAERSNEDDRGVFRHQVPSNNDNTPRKLARIDTNSGEQRFEDANYTWRNRDYSALDMRESILDSNRLAPLSTTMQGGRSTSSSAYPVESERERHQQDSIESTTPRLPGMSTLGTYSSYQRRATSPSASFQNRQRSDSYSMQPPQQQQGVKSPSGAEGLSAHSPSLSQASHATPRQAFLHPSLVGLPGSGGAAGSSKQQPSFVSKLYSMLEDDSIEDMIAWGSSGATFSVANPSEFAKIVLPNWFKHSNWQSFVRQLNMYGFHKVNHTYQGSPEEEIQVWEFKHPNFRRGEVQMLNDIKRKSSRHKRQDSLTRGMTHYPQDYDLGTPSPEMAIGPAVAHGQFVGHGPPQVLPQHQGYGNLSGPGRSSTSQTSFQRSMQGPSYQEYEGQQSGVPSSYNRGEMQNLRSGASSSNNPREVLHVTEGVNLRMDDLSDRIDAIIRHASYLEGQLRTVSDQLYHAQQNEASLRAHVHHLEAQMRSLSDQLFQQRQGSGNGGGAGAGAAGGGNSKSELPPPSPSSTPLPRLRQTGIGSSGISPPSNRESLNRYQTNAPSSSNFISRSPVLASRSTYTTGLPSSKERLQRVGGLSTSSSSEMYIQQQQQQQQQQSKASQRRSSSDSA